MRIHSDKLTRADLYAAMARVNGHSDQEGLAYLEKCTEHGSRKRARAFEVGLTGDDGGRDRHGVSRRPVNSGQFGAGPYTAATWYEWGDFIAELFKIDPKAIIGEYDGVASYLRQTAAMAAHRGKLHRVEFEPGVSPWAAALEGVA